MSQRSKQQNSAEDNMEMIFQNLNTPHESIFEDDNNQSHDLAESNRNSQNLQQQQINPNINETVFIKEKGCTCKASKCKSGHCYCHSKGLKCDQKCKCKNCQNDVDLINEKTKKISKYTTCKCENNFCSGKLCNCHSKGKLCSQKCKCKNCANKQNKQQNKIYPNSINRKYIRVPSC